MTETIWKIYGIRHAVNTVRTRGNNFILEADPNVPLVLDFYSWVLVSGDRHIVVDTGMAPQKAALHGHTHVLSPVEGLSALGVDAAAADTVILTHAHYDHIGFLDSFPAAHFHMQAEEMAYVTGPWMEKPWFRRAYEVDEIQRLVALLHAGRLTLHGREAEIADGVTVHWVGGHCAGQEVVRVRTARGWVVLASDALHYYEEYERGVPFAVVFNSSDMIAAHDTIRALADSDDHVLPAHDPRIAAIYPEAEGVGSEHIRRLDVAPGQGDAE
ncbi:glyoxylase-like metal-dependent hydrolase (beta-lactamase superfamily II) [Rhodobium orientis]|uniref:N-acyl homoserine lactonase family protein n=1 Tax=Rhodobium orientis TaxID=34017 RepID=A0A327JHK0_9HYPH|nr:N-acyl homoserine lactonase family protein [Rhodobium orientis]MBB4303243.1 glyoxylase-like metal-dependent hydrolase (beta-lactamase superfamily II) [Rhodobium orientis]MBK5951657.1 N-acyl homoserine lactonase family protein [Rhodobium orientis]RAI25867.1 N-acyl homoserine lactonase family protein [Rhodobium orientis]